MKNATDSIAVIIVAGGSGARMGARLPKQFLPLDGRPVLMHTVQRFADALPQSRIVVVLPSSHIEYWDKLCRRHGFAVPHIVCTGGANRFESVSNGLRHAGEAELIAVHDGVRPLVSREIIERATEDARTYGAVIPVVRPIDSMRRIDRDGSRIVDRRLYRIVQTPKYSVPTSCGTRTPDRSTNGSPTMRASSKPPDNRSTYARARTKTSRSRRRSIC